MTIFDKTSFIGRTFIQQMNILFRMGKDLETVVDNLEVDGISISDQDGYYLLSVGSTSSASLINNQTYYTLNVGD